MSSRGNVLFVCLHGSAKSLIAAEHFNRIAAARGLGARATSAGTEPDDAIPPHVIPGLPAGGIARDGHPRERAPRCDAAWPPAVRTLANVRRCLCSRATR